MDKNKILAGLMWAADAIGFAAIIKSSLPSSFTSPGTPSYALTFEEMGLPSGTEWGLTINGQNYTTKQSSLVVNLPNGNYNAVVISPSGYSAYPSDFIFAVQGQSYDYGTIYFSPSTTTTYVVTFTESGLPSGTEWSVTLGNQTKTSTGTSISFSVPSGQYTVSASATGYTAYYMTPIYVNGNVTKGVSFLPIIQPGSRCRLTFHASGLPEGIPYMVMLNGHAVEQYFYNGDYAVAVEPGVTYKYEFFDLPADYAASPQSGTITIPENCNVTVDVAFKYNGPSSPCAGVTLSKPLPDSVYVEETSEPASVSIPPGQVVVNIMTIAQACCGESTMTGIIQIDGDNTQQLYNCNPCAGNFWVNINGINYPYCWQSQVLLPPGEHTFAIEPRNSSGTYKGLTSGTFVIPETGNVVDVFIPAEVI